ncbi:LysR family transcriptional regulator [Stenotrophomonas maltophilia]|uniref:LysR family transcriptional regulator n=1 Tax=Stenotrophomonas maltophilia TaxID=40324 RepID=UPI00046AF9BD|nr:LysR family transcriptional regulator [Stenotrophomonas maltophilia]OMP38970.1 LysR family transcriptional regulator [Stenotrophomonas sp. KAs 5-3]AIL07933.1 bacterial regulatory helix-turn-helix, lysR family protein [Stenotrophomonas maltophilia]OOD10363.1 LysR family transcriptional regulator [Stenotrophomonas maltophilia]QQA83605.1 LysR family transcriptional regulator [Stenotrophomonas maltophilia]WQE24807.1 LysR family transcriptional regulator [Stenotrophomonas maltophilia]
MDTLRCMQAFVAVAECGSFAGAAEQLQVSAVMVGKYIQQLEAHLGTSLLQRNTRRQRLTEAGSAYLAGCRQVLEQVQQAEADVAGLQVQPRGLLRVSAPTTWGSCVLAPQLAGLLRAQPQLNVELDLSNRRVDLIEDGFDVAIRVGPLPSQEVVARPLPPYAMSLCAAPSYLRRRGTPRTPADLEGHDCLSHLAWRGGHGWQLANGEQVDWEARLTCNDGVALREAAVAGAGLVLQPTALLAGEIAAGRLKPLLRDYLPEPRPMHLIYLPDRRPRPRLQCFVDFVMTMLGQ